MPSTELLLAFIAATAVFAYMPGPAMLYTAAQTMARGRHAGLMASLGIHLGGYGHVVAAALGLSAIFEAVPAAYLAVKLAGAAYLVFLGIQLFRGPKGEGAELVVPKKTGRRAFAESVAVELLNPKTAIFFIAFLPQFADPGAALPLWVQLLLLGTVVNLMFSSADLLCVLFAGYAMQRLRQSGTVQRVLQRLGGLLLIGLGIRLAMDR